jgi:hypothetical protein
VFGMGAFVQTTSQRLLVLVVERQGAMLHGIRLQEAIKASPLSGIGVNQASRHILTHLVNVNVDVNVEVVVYGLSCTTTTTFTSTSTSTARSSANTYAALRPHRVA